MGSLESPAPDNLIVANFSRRKLVADLTTLANDPTQQKILKRNDRPRRTTRADFMDFRHAIDKLVELQQVETSQLSFDYIEEEIAAGLRDEIEVKKQKFSDQQWNDVEHVASKRQYLPQLKEEQAELIGTLDT